jgi:hypothetical protein
MHVYIVAFDQRASGALPDVVAALAGASFIPALTSAPVDSTSATANQATCRHVDFMMVPFVAASARHPR